MFARTMHTTMRRAFVVLLISLMAATTASARVTFLPGAVTPTGEVDFARYDLTSPQQGYYRRNTTRVEVTSSSVGYLAAPVVVLDPIVATLVDHFGIPVFRGFQCQVILSLVDYPAPLGRLAPASIIPPRTVVAPIGHQIGTYYGITLIAPPVGKYRLRLRAAHSNMTRDDAVGSFEFAILPNNIPVRLEWLRPPLYYTNSYTPLARQPVLRLVDAVGNTVVDPRAIGNITVTVTNASSAVPGTVITNGIIATSQGVAIFNTLGVHVLPRYQGFIYNLTFTYTSTAPDRVLQTLVVNTTIRSSFCNTSSLQPAVYYYPNRTRAGGGDALVTIRGGPFLASMPQQLICRVNGQLSPAIFIDECNVNCSVPDIAIGGVASVSISIDGGTDFSDPMSVYFLGVDSALRLGFDDPSAESSNVIQLDPLGNTRVGNISVYVMDQHALDMWNFTLQDYSATLTSTALSLSGTVATNTLGGYGKFRNITFLGFPEVGDYVLSVSAVNVITQETLFGQRRVSLAYTRDICVPPPIATSISSIGCKTVGGPISLTLCGSGEIHPVTVHGKYFGLSGATAYVGSVKCNETLHDSVNVGSQLNCKCFFPTTNSTLTIVTSTAQIYVTPTPAFYMSSPVNVSQVIGCPTNIFPSTGACFTNTSTRVTVLGTNFGTANATVFLNHIITNIAIRCTNAVHSATSPTTSISCTIPVALGVGLVVSVRNYQTGQLGYPANYAAVSYVPSNGVLCQTDSEGYFCSQRGVCFLQNGTCNCVKAAASGFWTGEFCQTCVTGYYGAACTTACPLCSATSTCDDGVDGTGACVCQYGWGGALCDVACPGGSATPCSNHGVCISSTLACTCYNSDATGYWTGTTCSACSEGWSGSACMTVCPRASNRVCSGHGTCVDGTCKCSQNYCDSACNVSFAGCSGCVNGTYGKDCSLVCPGGIDNICFGNGYCGDGPFGNGLCTCNDGWGGANCTITCPHGPTNLCSGNGQCNVETGICTCNAGYTLADCGQECPGGASNPCNGQGTCNVATSTCACNDGWSSADCSVACPGGSSSPCNLHGQCIQSNSTCQCYADATRGHWAGATCSVCDSEWWGTGCRQQCPFAYNTQCGGHGQCSDAVVCTCYESSTTGFWSGSNCGNCAFGYYGSDCTLECPGTSCNPCYSRGNCSQGVNGTGLCTCDSTTDLGYWSGVVCDACSTDYYGDNCTSKCPTGLQNLTCSNRGSCDDGRFGAGTCTCYGTYGGTVCDVCATGYHGTGCATMCPGLVGQPCLLRGTCVNTEASNGTCTCNAGYGGSMCQYICPTGPYGICNGQGTCVLNSGGTAMICTNCSSSATTGYWTGDSCSSCVSGYYGSLCKNACPGGASSPCNNRGTCNMGYSGNGECTCTSGYAGLSCEKTCVGGALIPCSGHGTCDSVTGECNCYSSAQDGFWVDSACDSCDAAYLSSSCTVPCPTSITGTACSGHGTCYQGICLVCTSGFCGPTCSATTGCINCPLGTFGTICQDCPGGRSTPCSNQGICLQGAFGSGACVCNQGYKGTNCSISCPGPAGVPCYGRGTCDATGACACNANWAGSDCNTPCNGFDQRLANSTSCSGVGTCSKVDGSCTCVYGYGGASCETTCPGTGSPCNGRGYCSPVDGTCQCYKNSSIGFWNGLSCSYCQPGYYGANDCLRQCYQGVSDSTFTQCVCNEYWSGIGCETPCPGLLNGSNVCYGHGSCAWGRNFFSLCTCNATWYDPNCLTYCTKAGCDSLLINGQCNVDTGVCECEFDANGHWDYTDATKTSCDVCNVYYFGATCESPCACSRHGTCDRRTGACTCYADTTRGYWGGTSCAVCATGYIGVNCQNLNVAISPLGTVAAVATVPALDVIVGVICQDPLYPFIYIGTSPVMVLSSADVTLATLNLGGFAMECVYRSARELYIVTFSEARIRLNVINRQTGEYLRTEYVPLPSAVSSTPAPAVASFQRQLLQFEVINATILNGAVMGATSILLPFSGVSEDILIIPYGVGIVQFYQISSGVQVLLQTSFYEIVDAGTIEGIDNSFVIAAVVGNASLSHWEVALCDNSMPTSVNTTLVPLSTFYSRYGAYVASVCASCTPTKVFGDGDLIVMLFASAGVGMYLTRMSANATVPAYNDSMTTDSMEPYFAMQYFYGSVCDVTATIIDGYASVGYFAMTCGSDPSVIMKFRLSTCYVTGIIALSRVGTDAVTVVRMSIDQSLRMLQVLTPLSRSQQMQKVSLYAVSELTPLLADTKGGTLITVTGEGFISGMTCVFNSVTTTPAIFIDQTSLICVAPPGGTVSCAGEPVEVNLAGAGSTNNAQLLQRVASASIREVINNITDEALGFLSGSFVTVRGSGFILPSNASLLLCKLYSPTDLSATSITVVATLISSYEVLCVLPPVPGPVPKPSYLEVSIDGTVFSDSRITYDVVGTPSSLFISAPLSGELTVRAARLTQLPAVYVNVADSVSHPLGIYTNSTHLVQATTASGSTFQLLGTTLLNTTSGLATFSNLSILDPSTGTVQLTFSDMEHQWNAYLYFTVVEGEPHQMYFVRYPSNATTNVNPTLSIQPVVGILDASGNPLTSLTDKSVDIKTITLEYWYHDLNDQVVVRVVAVSALNAQFRVEGVSITGKHEEPYYLNFSSDLLPVPVLISDAIVVGWCETTEFAIANSTACEACPANAVCDGTFEIRAQDNWWRADNTTLVFYSCGAPYSGDSCYDNGECRPGYSGPRCSLCEQGFGKSGRFCERCQSSDTNNAIVLIACVALLCLVTLMVYTIVMTSSKDLVPVLFRNLVTYIQILARLSDTNMPWPATLDDLWRFISSIANLQAIDFSPFDCAMKVNFFEKYIVTLLIPWFMIVLVAPLAIIVVKLYTKEDETTATALDVAAACRKEEDESLLHEITEATAQRRVTMIGEPSRRFPASNPLDAKQADVLSPGLASVLHNDVLKAVAEGEARKRLNDWSEEALTKNRIDHVAHILSMRHARYTTGAVIVITAVTIFTLLYPTLVQSSGQVLQCESMDLGRQGVVSLSSNQRDVSCSSAYFKFYATLAISMIMVYGVSIPFGLIVVVLLLQRWGGMSLARAVLAFTMAGLKPELWFWETVNMMRKFLSMMVVVFVSDAKLQMIVFMWVTVIGFVLNVTFSPYTSRLVYLLECLGMAATVATMNLVLMFFFFSSASNSADVYEGWGAAALSAGIIAVNAVAILSYLAAIAKHSWIRFTKWRGSRANEDALEEAVQNRMLSMKDVVEEVRTLRSRRSELDAAIQAIEERLDDVLEEDTASPTYHSNSGLVNWQFPTDENPFGGDEEVSEGDEETPSEEDGGGESVDAKGAPTRESSRRTTVTFTAEAPEKAASNRRRSIWKRAVSQRAALKDFSIASQHDFVQRNSSANLHAWVDPEPAVSADPTAKDPLAGSKGPDQPQTYLDGKELLAALGEDDEQSPLHLPKHSLFGAFRRTLRGGSDSDMEKSPSPSPKGPQAHQYGGVLSAEALRRMQQDDRVASPLPQAQMQVPGDSLGSGQWKQLNPNMLLDSNTSSSDRGGMTPKRLIPLPRKAVAERVQSWQQELTVGDEVDSPTTQSVRFDHHYMRDEEAEMEFLEGKIDQPPPPIRAVFLPPPRNDFSFLAEIENLDKHISDGMDLPSNAALEAQRVAQPPVRPFDPSAFLIPDLEEYEEPVPVIAQRVLRGAETLPAARLAASGITTNSRTPNKPMRKRSGKKMDFLLMMGASSESEEGDESGQEQPRHDRFSLGLQPMPVLQRLGETSGVGQLPSEDFRMSAVGAQDMTDNVLGQDFLMSILSPSKPITSAPEPPGSISSILQRTLTSRLRSMRDSKAAQSSSSEAPRKDDAFEGAASSGNSAVEIGDTSTHSRSHSAKRPQVTFEVVGTTLPSNPVLSPLSADGFSQPARALAGSLSLGTHPLLDIGEDVHHVPRGVSYEAPVDMETALQRIFDSSQPTPPPGTTTALGLPDRPHAFDSSEWSAEGAELDTPIVDPISVPIFVDDFVSTTMEREPSTLFEYNIPVARAMPTAAEMFPKTSTDAHKPRRGFHSTKLSDAEQELPVPKLLPKRHTHQSFDPERFFDGLLDFKEDPLPTKVQPGFLQLKSVSKATVLPTAKNPLGAPPPVQEPPKVPPLRNFETRSGVAAFLDHDEETPQHDYPQPAFLTSEEPWFARNPVTAQLVASPLITRPTFTDHPSRAQTERKERRKSNVLGGSRFRSTTSRSSLRPSTTSETHRPLSPLVVDWEDDDG